MASIYARNGAFCACIAGILCLAVLAGISTNVSACFGFRIDCEGTTTGWQYDSGAVDVQYWSLKPVPNSVSLGGGQHTYIVHLTYSPGCGNQYSSKFLVKEDTLLPGWSYTVTDGGGGNINGAGRTLTGTGDFYAYFTVSSPAGAVDGDRTKLTLRWWGNDTAACNEHNTVDIATETYASTFPPLFIKLATPIGGEEWAPQTHHEIVWSSSGGNGTVAVKMEYSSTGNGSKWTVIASGVANTGLYMWIVPDVHSFNCIVKITATDSGSPPQNVVSYSKSPFTIKKITLISPNGGERWKAGTAHDIVWDAGGALVEQRIRIRYAYEVGANRQFFIVVLDMSNDGKYTWTVPNTPSDACYIEVTATDTGPHAKSDADTSKSAFAIATGDIPYLSLTGPAGGESWTGGSEHDIVWTATGGNGSYTVRLEYSTNGPGGPWIECASGVPNTGTYPWTVANDPSPNCYVRVTLLGGGGNISATNAKPFTIVQGVVPDMPAPAMAVAAACLLAATVLASSRRRKGESE